MREALLEAYLVARVKELGGITAKMTVAGRRGWPDRLICLPGGVMALAELKRPKKSSVTQVQQALHNQLGNMGVNLATLRTYDEVDAFLSVIRDRSHEHLVMDTEALRAFVDRTFDERR